MLNMCDGVLLVVDSVEGPKPQTRFVLDKGESVLSRRFMFGGVWGYVPICLVC